MKLVLLDRDGVINEDIESSVKSISEFRLIPGTLEAISLFNQANLRIAIVTNQAVVGRGIITANVLNDIHFYMQSLFKEKDAHIDSIFTCTSADPSDPRRKPNPGLLIEALDHFKISPCDAALIGDSLRDIEAASLAGCHRYLVLTGNGRKTINEGIPASLQPLKVCKDLLTSAKDIVRGLSSKTTN